MAEQPGELAGGVGEAGGHLSAGHDQLRQSNDEERHEAGGNSGQQAEEWPKGGGDEWQNEERTTGHEGAGQRDFQSRLGGGPEQAVERSQGSPEHQPMPSTSRHEQVYEAPRFRPPGSQPPRNPPSEADALFQEGHQGQVRGGHAAPWLEQVRGSIRDCASGTHVEMVNAIMRSSCWRVASDSLGYAR
jgi:hypothetical protein